MVFLRLHVKVFPRDREDASCDNNNPAVRKPATCFLIVLGKPEGITLGGLAGIIQDKWRMLRPHADPLEIKKLVDDAYEYVDLDTEMTVAEVFVDNGKALQEGSDQRATVRVIQKPWQYAPVRFPSVVQDWNAAAQSFEPQIQIKKETVKAAKRQIPAVNEGKNEVASFGTPDRRLSNLDIPVSSVERDGIPGSPSAWKKQAFVHGESSRDQSESAITTTPLHKRMESQELGDSPSPSHTPAPRAQQSPAKHKGSTRRSITKEVTASPVAPSQEQQCNDASLSPLHFRQLGHEIQMSVYGDEDSRVSADDRIEDEHHAKPRLGGKDRSQDPDVVAISPSLASMEGNTSNNTIIGAAKPDNGVSRKRRLSKQDFEPSKEPRLDVPQNTVDSGKNVVITPAVSPHTPRKCAGLPLFPGCGRRLSFSGRAPSKPPKPGLGLGITKSPSNKPPVLLDLSQESAVPAQPVVQAPSFTPEVPSSETAIQGALSLPQKSITPSKSQTPLKGLHSALRKDSPAEGLCERRSVSFADEEEVMFTSSNAVKKPAPLKPGAKAPSTKRRSSGPSSLGVPSDVPQDKLKQDREEARKDIRHNRELFTEDLKQKIKTAQDQKADHRYIQKLQRISDTLNSFKEDENDHRTSTRTETLRKKVEKIQASMKPKPTLVSASQKSKPTTSSQELKGHTPCSHPNSISRKTTASINKKATPGPRRAQTSSHQEIVELSSGSEGESYGSIKPGLLRCDNTSSLPPASQPVPTQSWTGSWTHPSRKTGSRHPTLKSLRHDQMKEIEAKAQASCVVNTISRKTDTIPPLLESSEESSGSSDSDSDSDSD
ncbi:hypothetical protein BO70DRAFT_378561 [Aspergillus heteromorphus CBS 117.55]|uniref:Nucleolar protein Dnt1-like N-terminal domain-containing protein n=1 Tax=Aspergillus heteromorphus CBS 117.55 TaxID=1448321 RepID=A0A317WKV6_9EURO|nr:uncharacterized protein BO70DRAFT_378561 [Aspergillus heteromorphus CBS 117.55]PWY86939.1 hypothetical protein BO70DRAFT_378561 [Aspergillus heteromorphus CBS 117.55]